MMSRLQITMNTENVFQLEEKGNQIATRVDRKEKKSLLDMCHRLMNIVRQMCPSLLKVLTFARRTTGKYIAKTFTCRRLYSWRKPARPWLLTRLISSNSKTCSCSLISWDNCCRSSLIGSNRQNSFRFHQRRANAVDLCLSLSHSCLEWICLSFHSFCPNDKAIVGGEGSADATPSQQRILLSYIQRFWMNTSFATIECLCRMQSEIEDFDSLYPCRTKSDRRHRVRIQ